MILGIFVFGVVILDFFVVILVVVAVNLLRKQCIRNEKERETDREIVIVSVSGRSHFS